MIQPPDATAEVLPFDAGGRTYSYAVPPTLAGKIQTGQLVRVPLGSSTRLGIVWSIGDSAEGADGAATSPQQQQDVPPQNAAADSLFPELFAAAPTPVATPPPRTLRSILQLCHEAPVLSRDLPKLSLWMAAYYAAPLNSVLETVLPAVVRQGVAPVVQRKLRLAKKLEADVLEKLRRRAPKQAALYDFLAAQIVPVERSATLNGLAVSAAALATLIAAGVVEETTSTLFRDAYADELGDAEFVAADAPVLNAEQQAALDTIRAAQATQKFHAHLLHGVTGSGKTEVYIGAIREALAAGGSVIFLVPEVVLTPQTVGRLRQRLGAVCGEYGVVVWHSNLGAGERFDAWMAMAQGKARIVVGARSAVFAPVQKLQLIVVDEEHESSYKQSETPLYHGRDVAVYRARLNNAVALLGSATPSLESYANVRSGKYGVSRLLARVDNRAMPAFRIVDMRRELLAARGQTVLSRPLVDALHKRLERGEQSILFLNRRGFSRQMICPKCGYVAGCPHCSIALTHHRAEHSLRCHACGHREPPPSSCPQCHSPDIRGRGAGTQKLEDVLRTIIPKIRVMRLDADTMGRKNLFREVLSDFRKGKLDVLLGTQMLAKGLDFPNVTLVGIVDADISLHMPDFRAAERTFQLLVQVAGRAGRGDRAGEVLVQTLTPEAAPILFAKRSDFDTFLEDELALRQEHGYPPVRHLIRHLFCGRNNEKVAYVAENWVKFLEANAPGLVEMRGPSPCPLERLRDNYRWNAWYFTDRVANAVANIRRLRAQFNFGTDVADTIDVDASDLS